MGDIVNIVINPNKCAKCGAETTNLVVCNSCNLPPGETKYYHFSDNRGECFFRVRGSDQDVLQIVTKTSPGVKKGSYKKGVYYIRYNSFIGNKGWKLSEKLKENGYIKEISKTTFDSVLDQVTNGFKDPVQKPIGKEARFLAKKPDELHVIITLEKWYPICEIKDGKVKVFLDNEYAHWIPEECLEIR